jgi:hypothetical protein
MAVQLILKNSSVQDKEATALQLANGEIALNYHQSGPFLQCKDSNGDVWRIGGVIIGANAPSSPSKGAWWFNESTDVLKFYDGSAWNEIFVNSIVDGDIDANAEIAVSKLADGTARQLLQTDAAGTGVEWTDDVDVPGTLDVTGVATFDNNVVITGNLTVNGTTTTIDTTTLIVEDKNIEMGSVDSPTDVTADGGGLTLKGATDKTFNWVNSTDSWTSSENVDLASGKTYKVNGTDVLSGSSLGSGVTGSSLTSVGTITSGTWNGTTVATGSGGTGQTTYTNGQLLIGKTDGTLNKATLTAGTNISITNSDGGIEIATSGAGINNVVEDTTPQLGGDLDVNGQSIVSVSNGNIPITPNGTGQIQLTNPQLATDLDIQANAITTTTTDGDIDLDANGAGLIQVTEFNLSQVPIVTQHDIGTAANEVPLNGMLGGMAFQDPASVSVDALNSSGRVLVGSSSARSPVSATPLIQVEGTTYATSSISITQNSNDSNSANFYLAKSRGGSLGSHTVVQSGDEVGSIDFLGADGSQMVRAARIQCVSDGTPGANDMPGRLVFSTTADGASNPTLRLTIKRDGTFIFDNTTDLIPETDNVTNLGKSGHRWTAVWAANGTIQTSDERAKSNIAESSLGSAFIKSLRPVSYKWIEGGKRDTGERDEDNNYIYESVPGTRTHWGFIAQEVKQAVDDAGVDFGGWVLTDKDDPDSEQALRYDQFIAPLTKALQEAIAKIETLETTNASLEARLTALEGGTN